MYIPTQNLHGICPREQVVEPAPVQEAPEPVAEPVPQSPAEQVGIPLTLGVLGFRGLGFRV